MTDPKLVEALVGGLGDGDRGPLEARFVQSLHQGMGLEYADAERWADIFMRSVRGVLTRRIEQHRLVQLPEEPSGWVTPENAALIHNSSDVETVVIERHPDDNVPVYIIPGDPQEVDEQGYRARVYGEFPPEDPQEVEP